MAGIGELTVNGCGKTHWVGKVVQELSSGSAHAGRKEIAFVCRKSYVNFLRGASNNVMPLFVF